MSEIQQLFFFGYVLPGALTAIQLGILIWHDYENDRVTLKLPESIFFVLIPIINLVGFFISAYVLIVLAIKELKSMPRKEDKDEQ